MVWSPMDVEKLPRLLCGPILRRVDNESVTVWVTLKRELVDAPQAAVELVVRVKGGAQVMQGSIVPTVLDRLHIAAVRATGTPLVPGQRYEYEVRYAGIPVVDEGTKAECNFEYMPADLQKVRIAHASCRKPDGAGRDALAALSREVRSGEVGRPHLLLLTGDQIYADGVAGPLLFLIMDAGAALLGGLKDSGCPEKEVYALPYARVPLLEYAQVRHSYRPDCHLIGFHEYLLMHLFVWSDLLWGSDLPTAAEADARLEELTNSLIVHGGRPDKDGLRPHERQWSEECARLRQFRADIPAVRSLLCSTPTLMIFDDHEVTDDWRLHKTWIADVIGGDLGRRFELNALLAYSLAQGSGNDAARFNPMLAEVVRGDDVTQWRDRLAARLGWVTMKNGQEGEGVRFHYTVLQPACNVVVLDTRTRRGFDRGEYASLIAPSHLADEVGGSNEPKPLLLVSPAPLFGNLVSEMAQLFLAERPGLSRAVYWGLDQESMRRIPADQFDAMLNAEAEAWSLEPQARVDLVTRLLSAWPWVPFIVVLSGDVHYAFSQTATLEKPSFRRIVQLTSSAALNREAKSYALMAVRQDTAPMVQLLLGGTKTPPIDEGELRYTLELHRASITVKERTLIAPIVWGHLLVTEAVRAFKTLVHGQNNCGLVAFPQPGVLTHTLVTQDMGDPAHVTWTIPV